MNTTTSATQSHHQPPVVYAPEGLQQSTPDPTDTVVLYHANCNDGFGAAWAVWKALGDTDVTYFPVAYGHPIPEFCRSARRVIIVDFSYPATELEDLYQQIDELLVLDHHKTAEAELAGLPYAHFDQKKSGAMLAWEHFHDSAPPALLAYVQDRDLWQWALPDSREINEALGTFIDHDFHLWSHYADHWNDQVTDLITQGSIALDVKRIQVERLTEKPAWLEIDGHIVPAVNSPLWQSEIGEMLCWRFDAPFAAVWSTRRDGSKTFSLRSRERLQPPGNDPGAGVTNMSRHVHDCSATAAKYGGGGHHQAAGFKTDVAFIYQAAPASAPAAVEFSWN